ncbi:MAG: hypothetical protein KME42_21920 [Tildeniella nuda ZEHNDER 1965/U140]|nr:hypothetical protein [Tildeniella nuda ZEHNDER 1965/U140]
MTALSHYFSLHRRYHRSINLERDFDNPDAVESYVLTERSLEALQRMLAAFENPKAQRAWTLIGVYGTGKSAFANYLTALCAPENSKAANQAWHVTEQALPKESPLLEQILETLPPQGLLRCVAVGQREPLSWTVMRALANGCQEFWSRKQKPDWFQTLTDWGAEVAVGRCQITNQQVLTLLEQVTQAAKTQVLLVLDELGKNLEYAVNHGGTDDLYLLQQIAELRYKGKYQVHFVGLLHQSFAGYSERLSAIEQNEWTKIQGRFETMQFTESASQMTRLIGQAIERSEGEASDRLASVCDQTAKAWFKALKPVLVGQGIAAKDLSAAYPLHPMTALVLPLLCTRYAQNDRSLFTFLTSHEPHGLTEFLTASTFDGDRIPTLQLHQLYDYFVEAATGLASRINLQRWVEIQGLIQDAQTQNEAVLNVLKTIGILNLITATGALKASPALVAFALCDHPDDTAALEHWQAVIKDLTQKGIITYRNQTDDLKLWEGSDFNVEAAIYQLLEKERLPLAQLLTRARPLQPIVAQRHYSTTGNLRYFEQQYADSLTPLTALCCHAPSTDGLIVYWLDRQLPGETPAQTVDGKPLIVITTTQLDLLRTRAQQLQALKTIHKEATALQTDGVARREVKHRLVDAERLLDDTLQQAFNWSVGQNQCWIAGKATIIPKTQAFQALLSDLCDRTYHLGLRLDNEFINRRGLTSQSAKARRELIEAMLEQSHQPRLGLEGYGPEVAMYYSVLEATGIHRQGEEEWDFQPPKLESGVATVWQAIEQFCLGATNQPQSLQQLYQQLANPPYGVKQGVIPVLLAALLIYYIDEVSVYKDGTFISVLGAEHFELLVKDPARFTVKHIEVAGVRSQVFRELEAMLRSSPAKGRTGSRNLTILSVVKPLVQFARKLPAYTLKSKRISTEAQAVIQTLLQTQEPDELLFTALPQACGLKPIRLAPPEAEASTVNDETETATARLFREKLVQVLREIHSAYDTLLMECETLLYHAFGLRSDRHQIRQDLQFRAKYLLGNCLEMSLNRFVRAAADETVSDRIWLESLLMIVADKPTEAWAEKDVTAFELNLSDLARRFKNLEALQKEVAAGSSGGFEVRRLTVTRPDGSEIHRMVWVDQEQQPFVDGLVAELLARTDLCNQPQLQQALVARLTETVLGNASQFLLALSSDRPQPIYP